MTDVTPLDTARRFLARHRDEHLAHDTERLVARCADHLQQHFDIAARAARLTAMEALAELEAGSAPVAVIDIDRSTSRMAIVRALDTDTVHMVTAAELLALVRRRAAQASQPAPSG